MVQNPRSRSARLRVRPATPSPQMGHRKPDRAEANRRLTENSWRDGGHPLRGAGRARCIAKPLDQPPDRIEAAQASPAAFAKAPRIRPSSALLTGEWLGGPGHSPPPLRRLPRRPLHRLHLPRIRTSMTTGHQGRPQGGRPPPPRAGPARPFESRCRAAASTRLADVNLTAPDSPPVLLPDANPTSP